MTTNRRCPKCHSRLPRVLHFTHPEDGAELLFAGIAFAVGLMGTVFAALHSILYPDTPPERLAAGAALYGILWCEMGIATSLFRYWWSRSHPAVDDEEDPGPEPADDAWNQDVHLGGNFRLVTREGQHVVYLRERGFHVPAQPERGALTHWLWAAHDGKVTFSQRGAREAVKDTQEVRDWATAILALWCKAEWCAPRSGWNGDRPDLSNGVRDVDEDVLYEVARTGQSGMIDLLLDLVEASVDPSAPAAGSPSPA